MQNLSISLSHTKSGALLVTMAVISMSAANFRSFHPDPGMTWEDMAREAERMALERWPGEISYRLMLPVGDCGHVHD